MKNPKQSLPPPWALQTGAAALLTLALASTSQAYPDGRVTFGNDLPFKGGYAHSLSADTAEDLFTVSGWADANATVSANLYNWWYLLGVDSGTGNGALIDGAESETIQLDKGVGAAKISFIYTGGNGSGSGNLARISIAGFSSDPGASPSSTQRISNISYVNGVVSFDYLDDGGGSASGSLFLANPAATAGANLKVTVAASPNGNATSAFAALMGLDIQEAMGGPQVQPVSIFDNSASSYATADGALTIRGYSDLGASVPANLGRYDDECFGIAGPSTVSGNSTITFQFAADSGLARLDTRYSSGTLTIAGFASDPGFVAPDGGASSSSFAGGTLTIGIGDGGVHSYYFTNRAASAGQTLKLNAANSGDQFGIGGLGYAKVHSVLAPDIPSEVSSTWSTPDGLLKLSGFSDTPGTVPANLHQASSWFGVSGGNNSQSIDGAESLQAQFASGAGLSGLGTRYTSGQVIVSGFAADPGFQDPSGTATGVSYASGTLTYTFNAPRSPEMVVKFANPAASAGKTLSLHTDGASGSQLTLTRINYATVAAPVTLTFTRSGSNLMLSWPGGTLQSSTEVSGTYTNVPNAANPYRVSTTEARRFFRVKVQ